MAGGGQLVSPLELLVLQAGQIDRRPLAAVDLFGRPVVVLEASHAPAEPSRLNRQLITHPNPAAGNAAGDNRAVTGQGERAIDGHTKRARFPAAVGVGGTGGRFAQRGPQGVDPLTRQRTGADQRPRGQERVGHQLADLLLDQVDPLGFGQVALGQRDHAGIQVQQAKDLQVFAGLRLDRVVGRHHQQRQVDPGGPGQHVADEAFVAGHVDDPQPELAQHQFGKPQLDGDAASFLLRQAVGVNAGQGLHQRGLAVVDVSGGAEDQVDGHALILGRSACHDQRPGAAMRHPIKRQDLASPPHPLT